MSAIQSDCVLDADLLALLLSAQLFQFHLSGSNWL
jgi:hypothetical protein